MQLKFGNATRNRFHTKLNHTKQFAELSIQYPLYVISKVIIKNSLHEFATSNGRFKLC